jgi:transmembrane sensor
MAPLATQASQPPIDPVIVQHAIQWMTRMWSGEASDKDRGACLAWRQENPEHERAWQRLQVMEDKLGVVPHTVAHHALVQPAMTANASRRKTMRAFGLLLGVGATIYATRQTQSWQMVSSDISTGTGEIRTVTLADGTQIVLNTATAIDIVFDQYERRIVLRSGEVLITTAADSAAIKRPFKVQTQHGVVEALGTRFTTRDDGQSAYVAVYEGAVAISRHGDVQPIRVDAGYQTVFRAQQVAPLAPVHVRDLAWEKGILVAENMRVDALVATLSRYRSGIVRCDPAIAHLQLTGVYSLTDTDRALETMTLALPVDIVYRTRYWVTVRAKTTA